MVLAAGREESVGKQEALATVCQIYRYPVYVYIRRRGHGPHDAEDLAQEFFARLLEKDFLRGITREGGKFRSFLLVTLKRFLAGQWERSQARKRGGGKSLISLEQNSEERYKLEPVEHVTPERLFEQRWAFALMDKVMQSLKGEYQKRGRLLLFETLHPYLAGDSTLPGYAEAGAALGMSESAVKVAVHRLGKRFGMLLREEVARTVESPDDIPEETRHLISVSVAFGYSFSDR